MQMWSVKLDLELDKENAEEPKASSNAVHGHLLAINRNIPQEVLKQSSDEVLLAINDLLVERQSLSSQLTALKKEKDASNNALQVLKNDITVCNNKFSTLSNETRQLKMHWLAEKNDLETRVFQTVSLNTQLQGSLRKKEKDFEKLQTQLLKLVKDTSRAKPMITVSKPLLKNSSQVKSGSIRDAELEAYISTNQLLEKENLVLRTNIDKLKQTMQDLKQQFDQNMAILERSKQTEQEHIKDLRNQLLALETNQLNEPSIVPVSLPAFTEGSSESPFLNTPGSAKCGSSIEDYSKIDWVITEANTEIKRLRTRSDTINLSMLTTESSQLQAQLHEALTIIKEQDKLIHLALVGALPKTKEISTIVTAGSDILADFEKEFDSPLETRTNCESEKEKLLTPLVLCLNDDEFPCDNGITPSTLNSVKGWFK